MIKKYAASLLAFAVLAVPGAGFAQTTSTSAQIQALLQQIQALNDQIKQLQQQQAQLQQQKQQTSGEVATAILAMVREGSQGENVTALQALLASDPELYPEGLITGFFGKATARAVARFQARHGLEQVGFVGPQTLKRLRELLQKNPIAFEDDEDVQKAVDKLNNAMNKDAKSALKTIKRVCAKVAPGHLIAPGWLRKNNGTQPIVPLCQHLPPGIITNPNWPWPTPTSTPTSTPDVTAPTISNIFAAVGTSTATISWTTNENADTLIAYGTSTAYSASTAVNSTLVVSHSQALSNLTPSTIYHYQVKSKDASGNIAISSDQTLTTLAQGDVAAPVISSVVATPSSTSALIAWSTNEAATSKVYYSTSSVADPNAVGTLSVVDANLVTGHSVTLPGLTATTTYSFLIESADAVNNKATSSGSFVTI